MLILLHVYQKYITVLGVLTNTTYNSVQLTAFCLPNEQTLIVRPKQDEQ